MDLTDKAKDLRRNQTEAEKKLWSALRNRQLDGIKFSRQYACPPYVLDFYSEEKKLAIEVDGSQHADSASDQKRDEHLRLKGIHVLRIWNNDILQNMEGVLIMIKEHLNLSPAHSSNGPLPLPEGEGLDENHKRLCVAKIADAHGVRGLVKLRLFVENPELVGGPLCIHEEGDETLTVHLKNATNKYWIAEIDGISDRDAALALKGTNLHISRENLPETDEEEFYYDDLIGLMAVDENKHEIGKVISVQNFGASDLLEILPPSGLSFYLPFTDETVGDIIDGNIIVTIPEGLLE